MTTEPTPELVREVWAFLQKRYNTVVRQKSKAPLMRMAGRIVSRRTDMPREEFMTNAVTTIGRRIYVPFTIGEETPGWSLTSQLILAAHEHTHVEQWRKKPLRFWTRYARDTRFRALAEAEGLITEFETAYVFELAWDSVDARIATLDGYGITDADKAAARKLVEDRTWHGPMTEVGKALLDWRMKLGRLA